MVTKGAQSTRQFKVDKLKGSALTTPLWSCSTHQALLNIYRWPVMPMLFY
jgi:hypothetical protein